MSRPLLLSVLLLAAPAAAQSASDVTSAPPVAPAPNIPSPSPLGLETGARLLSGTTLGLPWGVYRGGLTNLYSGDMRLRLSAPEGASVVGTRYDDRSRTILLSYRADRTAQAAREFAVEQLRRQGFDLADRNSPAPGRASALLRRTDRLLAVQVTREAGGVLQVQYRFRDSQMPERLLASEAPDTLRVYAAPVNLDTLPVQPGRVYLTPPGDQADVQAQYRSGAVILSFSGNYTLQELLNFYVPLFVSGQGFIQTDETRQGNDQITLRFTRTQNRMTVRLDASPRGGNRVVLWYR